MQAASPRRRLGPYVEFDEIGAGGMATVSLGRVTGNAGFVRTVAIKRLHPHHAKDPALVAMLLDEARLASRIRHVNVVPILDVVTSPDEAWVVMEYVHGEPLHRLVGAAGDAGVPLGVALFTVAGALRGLHAAHEAESERGTPLGIVHRDVSPQNILLDLDGVPRVLDFGVAKAADRLQSTGAGTIKGKLRYMPPEQLAAGEVDRRADVYAASVVLWELLAGRRLILSDDSARAVHAILYDDPPTLAELGRNVLPEVDCIVRRGLAKVPEERFETALEMAQAIEATARMATPGEVGRWVRDTCGPALAERAALIRAIELSEPSLIDGGGLALDRRTPHVQAIDDQPTKAESLVVPVDFEKVTHLDNARPKLARGRQMARLVAISVALTAVVLGDVLWARQGRARLVVAEGSADPPPDRVTPLAASPVVPPAVAPLWVPSGVVAAAPSGAVRPPLALPARSRSTKPAARCNPPYIFEANGTKRYLPECI